MSYEEFNSTDDRSNPDTDGPGPGPPQPPTGPPPPPPPPPTGGCVPKVRRVLNSRGGYSICRSNNKRVTGCGPGGSVCPVSNELLLTSELGCFPPGTPYGKRFRVTHTIGTCGGFSLWAQGGSGAFSYRDDIGIVQPGRSVVEFAVVGDCVVFQQVIEDVPLILNWIMTTSGDAGNSPYGELLNFQVDRHCRLASAVLNKVLRGSGITQLQSLGWPIGIGTGDPQQILRSCANEPGGHYEIDSRLFSRASVRVPAWGVGDAISGFGLSHRNITEPNRTGTDCSGTYNATAQTGPTQGPTPVFDFLLPDGREITFSPAIPSGAAAPGTYDSVTTGTSQTCSYGYTHQLFLSNINAFGQFNYAETWAWEVLDPCVPGSEPRPQGGPLPPGINPETMQPYTQPGKCYGCGQ